MKVFISHSSEDRWIARRISEDLESRGVETFLDAKDISTGASVDQSIQKHLRDCDDCLILLSPAAVKSHWVLIEMGGALALEKRLIPILLHVGPNDIPSPISKHLARDLNEIEKYYAEVARRLGGERVPSSPPMEQPRESLPRRTVFPGMRVRITDTRPPLTAETMLIGWSEKMDEFFGQSATVQSLGKPERTAHLDIDNGRWVWSFDWLAPLD